MRRLLILFTALFFFFVFSKQAFASTNFLTKYDVTYTINTNATTHVAFKIGITNQTSKYFASLYTLHLGFSDMENIEASDPDGKIKPQLTTTKDEKRIDLNFNKKVVGVNNTLLFDLSFDTKDIANKTGNIWKINIPGLSTKNDFSAFDVTVEVPQSFGQPRYIKPNYPAALSPATNTLHFSKDELGTSGISLAYGNEQIYSYRLVYHLGNSNIFPITQEIALAPSTNYQDITLNDISPLPNQVRIDSDGNWLAEYSLLPAKKLDVTVTGRAKVYLSPKEEVVPANLLQDVLKSDRYWQVSDPKIQTLAKKLKDPLHIYEYLVSTLHYDFSRVSTGSDRLGALKTLENPKSAVCLEFTDLFISLSRAAGIPAREIDGYAFTRNAKERPLSLVQDILHAWPEYYDKDAKTWIMVDPTWGNTTGGIDYFNTLDFDHFTFAIKGKSSTSPVPAGGYKRRDSQNQKDISVTFTDSLGEIRSQFEMKSLLPEKSLSFLPVNGAIRVTNVGNTLVSNQTFTVTSMFLLPRKQTFTVGQLPPFGHIDIPVTLKSPSLLTKHTDTVTIAIGKDTLTQDIVIAPVFFDRVFFIGGGVFGVLTIIIWLIARKSRCLSLFK